MDNTIDPEPDRLQQAMRAIMRDLQVRTYYDACIAMERLVADLAATREELATRTAEARLFNDALYADAREFQLRRQGVTP